MLKKLLKYNLKNQFKFFGVIYGLIIFNAITARLLSSIDNAPTIITIMKDIFIGTMWAMIVNVFISNIFRVWHEFRSSMYGDESYLMHTLPVKSSTLYWSKFLGALIILITNIVISGIGILTVYADTALFEWVKNILDSISSTANTTAIIYIIILGAVIFLEILNIILTGFLAIIFGHKKNNNKILWSVISGFIIYTITQTAIIVVYAISGIFNSEMFGLFTGGGSSFDPQTIKNMLIESGFIYIALVAALGVVSAKMLNRGFDID